MMFASAIVVLRPPFRAADPVDYFAAAITQAADEPYYASLGLPAKFESLLSRKTGSSHLLRAHPPPGDGSLLCDAPELRLQAKLLWRRTPQVRTSVSFPRRPPNSRQALVVVQQLRS